VTSRLAAVGAAMLVFASLASAPVLAASVPEPPDYRTENYKAPVPATLRGAKVVTTDEAADLWRDGGAVFIDVLPKPPKPELPEGTVWREPPRYDIPGSLWLPDVGHGALSAEMEAWFGQHLATVTGGDKSRPVVFYCRTDCWMSWNAAKRALAWGYVGTIWYPDGTEGWEAAKLPLEERVSEPRPGENP
jgi:PQQ-dependent catabolism-associated CXXCW motif protein